MAQLHTDLVSIFEWVWSEEQRNGTNHEVKVGLGIKPFFLIKTLINVNLLYGTVDQWEKLTPNVHLRDFDLYVAESRFKNKRRTLTDIFPKSTQNVLFVKHWSQSTDKESMLHRRNFFGQEFHTELKIPQRRCKINITDFFKNSIKRQLF